MNRIKTIATLLLVLSFLSACTPDTPPVDEPDPIEIGPIVFHLGDESLRHDIDLSPYVDRDLAGADLPDTAFVIDDAGFTIIGDALNVLDPGTYDMTLTLDAEIVPFSLDIRVPTDGSVTPTIIPITEQVFQLGDPTPLQWTIDTKGLPLDDIRFNGASLAASDYDLTDGELRLSVSFLEQLEPTAGHTLAIVTVGGTASVTIVINDTPTLATKTDLIKFPGESITAESFLDLVSDAVGDLTVTFELLTDRGTLTDLDDGSFSFVPDGVFHGAVELRMTASDSYGASSSRVYTLTYKRVDPTLTGSPNLSYDRAVPQDIELLFDTSGIEDDSLSYPIQQLTQGLYELVPGDVLIDPETVGRVVLDASYLATLPVGDHPIVVITNAGSTTVTVSVNDTRTPTVDRANAVFVKFADSQPLHFVITPYQNVIDAASFTMIDLDWTVGTDYTYSGNVLTITADFLNTLSIGDHVVRLFGEPFITLTVQALQPPAWNGGDLPLVREQSVDDAPLVLPVLLYGREADVIVFLNGDQVDETSYAVTSDQIAFTSAWVATLPYGEHDIAITTSQGTLHVVLNVGDAPIANDGSQNVTKFTFETILAETLRVSAIEPFELTGVELRSITYHSYVELPATPSETGSISQSGLVGSGDFGTLTLDPQTMSFALQRADGWFGVVLFTYVAIDELGFESAPITMDVVYKQMAPVLADQNDKTYLLRESPASEADITYSIINASGDSDFPIHRLYHGDVLLVEDVDYAIPERDGSTRFFVLKSTYLNTLEPGIHEFTLYTDGGRVTFQLDILAPLSVVSHFTTFDKGSPETVSIELDGRPVTVDSIWIAGSQVPSEHVTLDGTTLSVSAVALSGLPYGTAEMTIVNGNGATSFTFDVVDSRLPFTTIASATYLESSMADIDIGLTLYDSTLIDVRIDGTTVDPEHYTLISNALIIDADLLETIFQADTTVELEIVTDDTTLTVDIAFTAAPLLPQLTQTSEDFHIDALSPVTFAVVMNDFTFNSIYHQGEALIDPDDYHYDAVTGELTFDPLALLELYDGSTSYNFTLHTTAGSNVGFTIFFDHPHNRVVNGSFETGTLYGFTAFSLWKDESGMMAWTDERVVTGGYFEDEAFSYGRTGTYNVGIYGGTITKDSGQERMGYLRSSDFILGGSGHISFQLGGGRNTSFAYVSVRDAATDAELARFGNRHFGNTALSQTDNAEAFLFTYYIDLTTIAGIDLGDSLYLIIVDGASNEWSVLSLDHLITYYETAPTFTSDQAAINILPLVAGTTTATNAIVNGTFDDGLNGWTDVNGVFSISDGYAISNVDGNAGTGVLRSSAFTIDGPNQYLQFDWAGWLALDKQLFVSIREVGTNIEVMRLVRRDNLSSYQAGDFHNHIYDLSGLDSTKLYYIEIADNANGDWAVQKIDNIRLVDEAAWLTVPEGDRGVTISGLPLAFTYVDPTT